MSGINTLIQTLIGSRLPAVMGPSYAYIIPIMSIINDNNTGNYASEHEVGGYNSFYKYLMDMLEQSLSKSCVWRHNS